MLRSRRSAISKVVSTSTAAAVASVPSTSSTSSYDDENYENDTTTNNECCCLPSLSSTASSSRPEDYDDDDEKDEYGRKDIIIIRYLHMRKMSYQKKIIWMGLVTSLYCFFSSIRFYKMLIQNMTIPSNHHHHQYNHSLSTTSSSYLRSNNINSNNNKTNVNNNYYEYGYDTNYPYCPRLPPRLEEYVDSIKSQPFQLLSKDNFVRQLPFMQQSKNQGTTGNIIKVCPQRFVHGYIPCVGVSKTYKSASVYEHVKFCLTVLENSGITPRILYTDDGTLTIVEEDLGHVTMMNSKIPLDFALQIQRIRCILLSNRIIHRDITWRNFIVDMEQGYISIIDFGDAFLWDDNNNNNNNEEEHHHGHNNIVYTYRNIINLFNMWWKSYDEESILSNLIVLTEKQLKGKRIWEPEHRWTSMNQNKLGRTIVLQSQQQKIQNQNQQSNTKKKESSPVLEDIAPPEVW